MPTEPLTEQELQEIREKLLIDGYLCGKKGSTTRTLVEGANLDRFILLAEIYRLRSENESLRQLASELEKLLNAERKAEGGVVGD